MLYFTRAEAIAFGAALFMYVASYFFVSRVFVNKNSFAAPPSGVTAYAFTGFRMNDGLYNRSGPNFRTEVFYRLVYFPLCKFDEYAFNRRHYYDLSETDVRSFGG